MRLSLLLLTAALAACSPAPQEAPPPETPAAAEVSAPDEATHTAVLDALSKSLAADLGQPVDFRVDELKTEGDWAWVVAMPQALGGGAIDFSKTKYAARDRAGMFDGGITYALLQRRDDAWTVRDFAVGPTDVAYLDWGRKYGAPGTLMGLETAAPAQ